MSYQPWHEPNIRVLPTIENTVSIGRAASTASTSTRTFISEKLRTMSNMFERAIAEVKEELKGLRDSHHETTAQLIEMFQHFIGGDGSSQNTSDTNSHDGKTAADRSQSESSQLREETGNSDEYQGSDSKSFHGFGDFDQDLPDHSLRRGN